MAQLKTSLVKEWKASKQKEPGKKKKSVLLAKDDESLPPLEEDEYWSSDEEGKEEEGGDQRQRGPEFAMAATRRQKAKEEDLWEAPMDSEGDDYFDNLTYHEDTLSVIKGVVSTPLGDDLPVWVTVDGGSMTQLMQSSLCYLYFI